MPWEPRYAEQEVRDAVAGALSYSDALRRLGLRPAGHNNRTLKRLIEHYGISVEHFDPNWTQRIRERPLKARPLYELLVENSTYDRGTLKRRLYESGLKARVCELCDQDELWHGRRMSLILDHINGVANDNRLENLRIVCPNCAATLETHCGRKNKIDRDPKACAHCQQPFTPKYGTQKYCSQLCGTHSPGPRDPVPGRRKVERPSHDQLLADLEAMPKEFTTPATMASVTAPVVVILAAGQGTRMRSATTKLMHPLCGWPMIAWPIEAARDAGAAKVVVVDAPERALNGAIPDGVAVSIQEQAKGTADAVQSAVEHFRDGGTVIVIAGDVPLITSDTIRELAAAHEHSGAAATMATMVLDDPSGYGRVVRADDGAVERVVETKAAGDATDAELQIREVNTGVFAFDGALLADALAHVRTNNAQGEQYLPDTLPILRGAGHSVAAHEVHDPSITLGVNDRAGLAAVTALAQERILARHMLAGVTIVNPAATTVDAGVEIGADTVIVPYCSLLGATRIGSSSTVGPLTTLIDTAVGDGASVVHSYSKGADIGDRVSVGPFAYLRPGAVLREGSKVGTFVEVKNSDIGAGTKVPHLSYIGDADIGERSNIGAGTITANYDGYAKHRTTIGSGVRISVDTMLVAPVTVGDEAYTGAGSVITKDIPPGALGVARERQSNIDGYAERRKERHRAESQDRP